MDPPSPRPQETSSNENHIIEDPDGTYNSDASSISSIHGEVLIPTKEDSFDNFEDEHTKDQEKNGNYNSHNFFGTNSRNSPVVESDGGIATERDPRVSLESSKEVNQQGARKENQEREISSRGPSEPESMYPQLQKRPSLLPPSSEKDIEAEGVSRSSHYLDGTPEKPQHSPFPSTGMLIFLAVTVVLVFSGLVGGLTYYAWEKKQLDPIRPPGPLDSNGAIDGRPNDFKPDNNSDDNNHFLLPPDEELLKLFAKVFDEKDGAPVLEALNDPTQPAGKAAQWMLFEDPGKTSPDLLPRSNEAWIQRYLLAYIYYSTSSNGTNSWRSCNPKNLSDAEKLNYSGRQSKIQTEIGGADDDESCQFASPTELPNGELVYSLIPSNRWLSGKDECTWGGVACGTTVVEDIQLPQSEEDDSLTTTPVQRHRSAVTSIVLAGQNLDGTLVRQMMELPHLEILDLSHNRLEGRIHQDFCGLKALRLQHNELTGTLPINFFNSSSFLMTELNIGANGLEGTIAENIGLMASHLRRLLLFDNTFTGTIPVLGYMPLEVFHAQNNHFSGILPFEYHYGGRWPETLREWWAFNNSLTGSIPVDIGRFVSGLEDLRLHRNELTGSIPESLGDLDRLARLDLRSNNLRGTLPESLGDLSSLQDLRVQFNSLEGAIPPSMCFLESMHTLEADCVFHDLFVEKETQTVLSVSVFTSNTIPDENIETEKEDEMRINRDESIPSFPTLSEAVASARQGSTDLPSVVPTLDSASNSTDLSMPSVESTTVRPTAQPTSFPTRSDGTTTEIQCYCCTKCCNARSGDCQGFSSIEV